MSRKTRSDSKLDALPQNQREALERWLLDENLGYQDACNRLYQDFGVRVSRSTLEAFYQRRQQERMLQKIAASAQASKTIVSEFRNNQSAAFDALMELIGQAAFEQKVKGGELSIATLKDLMDIAALGIKAKTDAKKIEQKDAEIQISREKLDLLKRKADQADAAKGLLENKELTEDQRAQRMREVFGIS